MHEANAHVEPKFGGLWRAVAALRHWVLAVSRVTAGPSEPCKKGLVPFPPSDPLERRCLQWQGTRAAPPGKRVASGLVTPVVGFLCARGLGAFSLRRGHQLLMNLVLVSKKRPLAFCCLVLCLLFFAAAASLHTRGHPVGAARWAAGFLGCNCKREPLQAPLGISLEEGYGATCALHGKFCQGLCSIINKPSFKEAVLGSLPGEAFVAGDVSTHNDGSSEPLLLWRRHRRRQLVTEGSKSPFGGFLPSAWHQHNIPTAIWSPTSTIGAPLRRLSPTDLLTVPPMPRGVLHRFF